MCFENLYHSNDIGAKFSDAATVAQDDDSLLPALSQCSVASREADVRVMTPVHLYTRQVLQTLVSIIIEKNKQKHVTKDTYKYSAN